MVAAIVLVIIVVGSVLFHFLSPWWFSPLASNWGYIDDTTVLTFWITGAVFAAVLLFVAYCVFRFRHKEGRKAAYEPENRRLESWLTGLTAIGVIAMLTPGLFVWAKFINVPDTATDVEVIGQQWEWSFRLPGADGKLGAADNRLISADNGIGVNPSDPLGKDDVLVQGNELYLSVDRPVRLLLRSVDVLHDFYVPQFRAKMDLIPGSVTHFWLTPTKTGTYEILCAELCGVGHPYMRGTVTVVTADEYAQWLATQPTFAGTSP